MFPTCEAEILHTTTNLKASTSEGYDNISTRILKQNMREEATPLAHIINLSLLLFRRRSVNTRTVQRLIWWAMELMVNGYGYR